MQNNCLKPNFGKLTLRIILTILSIAALGGCSNGRINKKHKVIKIQTEMLLQKENLVQEVAPFIPSLTPSAPPNHCLLRADTSIELNVSKSGYTRFFIEDERITDVFVYPQEALQVRIHNQGYLIIVPHDRSDNPLMEKIYLTITGEKGTTQDLSLRFTGKNPEPVKFIKSGVSSTIKGE